MGKLFLIRTLGAIAGKIDKYPNYQYNWTSQYNKSGRNIWYVFNE